MAFNEKLPEWHATGVEPPESKKTEGWKPDDKPPADWFNWLLNRAYKALLEIRSILGWHVEAAAPHAGHETPAGANEKASAALNAAVDHTNNHANRKDTHGAGAGYYLAKTSRSDQMPSFADMPDKPSSYPPSSHKHPKSDISDFPTSIAPTAHKNTHASGGSDALAPADIGAETPAGAQAKVNAHATNKSNPHTVTKSQVGLGNVDNIKQASKTEFDAHLAETMPHRYTDGTTAYRWGLKIVDGVVTMVYEEVV